MKRNKMDIAAGLAERATAAQTRADNAKARALSEPVRRWEKALAALGDIEDADARRALEAGLERARGEALKP